MDSDNALPDLRRSVQRAVVGLALFGMVTAGLIAVTQVGTAERIRAAEAASRSKALLEVIPAALRENDLLDGELLLEDATALGYAEPVSAFRAFQGGGVSAVILPWRTEEGYTGPIQGIVAIDRQGRILGVRVTAHKETPGLGDRVERRKSDWVLVFEGRALDNPPSDRWKVRKDGGDFDQLTGATITPRAIVKAVHAALDYAQREHANLFDELPQEQTDEIVFRNQP